MKAVRKFHILRALRTIQRFWRRKYVQVQVRSACKIQQMARRFLAVRAGQRVHLNIIRKRLLA